MKSMFRIRLAQVAFILSWSSGWVSAEIAIRYAETPAILVLRFLLGCLFVGLFLLLRRVNWAARFGAGVLHFDRRRRGESGVLISFRRRLLYAAVIGVLSQAVWLGAVMEAQRHGVSPGVNALINGLQPLLTAALLPIVLGRRPGMAVVFGILISLGGLVLVVWEELRLGASSPAAYLIPLVSVAAMTGAVLLRRLSQESAMHSPPRREGEPDSASETASPDPDVPVDRSRILPAVGRPPSRAFLLLVQFFASGMVTLILFLLFGSNDVVWHPVFLVTLLWLVLVPQIASYALLWYLVEQTSPDQASALFLASPPTTLLLSFLMFGEPISLTSIFGSAVVLSGLYLGLRSSGAPAWRGRVADGDGDR